MKSWLILFIVACSGILSSCSALTDIAAQDPYRGVTVPYQYGASNYGDLTVEQKRNYLSSHKKYSDDVIENILIGKVVRGMTDDHVIYAIGVADGIGTTDTDQGKRIKWKYTRHTESETHVVFEDDRVIEVRKINSAQ